MLAKNVNDNAAHQVQRVAFKLFASKLAPTGAFLIVMGSIAALAQAGLLPGFCRRNFSLRSICTT
ncbi:hypothetical protein C1Y30_27025 [Pseudomonas sp. GW704-F3]|nr:hypothetical protein C1Y30_27025 [Pseudomonas sp. GW704-F3]PMU89997.1 hypothetical protein C1Y28_25660 [Pseudomonas sp. GW704-F5]PMU98281.1 hypothetical protein C1Y29_29015 [Pseudomonas sp. MPBD4-3]PMV31780.1 hypothetical protein C1Y27_14330 [Pseudomonas sp. GW704-F2]